MSKIARFIIWICTKFTKNEIEQIIAGLLDFLKDRNPEIKPKDDFKEKHPNYRNFSYEKKHGKNLSPVKYRPGSPRVPEHTHRPSCQAPQAYLYSTTTVRSAHNYSARSADNSSNKKYDSAKPRPSTTAIALTYSIKDRSIT